MLLSIAQLWQVMLVEQFTPVLVKARKTEAKENCDNNNIINKGNVATARNSTHSKSYTRYSADQANTLFMGNLGKRLAARF